jgi:hypothetical protein
MIKYATTLRLGTAETEQAPRRFTKGGGPKRVDALCEDRSRTPESTCMGWLTRWRGP